MSKSIHLEITTIINITFNKKPIKLHIFQIFAYIYMRTSDASDEEITVYQEMLLRKAEIPGKYILVIIGLNK